MERESMSHQKIRASVLGRYENEERDEVADLTYDNLEPMKLQHNDKLTDEFREAYIQEWWRLVDETFGFRYMLEHPVLSQIWYWFLMAMTFRMCENPHWFFPFMGFLFGFLGNQIMFVFSHMLAHAEWLYVYDDIRIWRNWAAPVTGYLETRTGMKFWAFYHHHTHNEWFEYLGSSKPEYSLTGQLVHMQIYTFFYQPFKLLWTLVVTLAFPQTMGWWMLGFNLSGYYLWMGHDWSHLKNLEPAALGGSFFHAAMTVMSFLNINSARELHFDHHKHNHRTVYQDFSIGETFFPMVADRYFNRLWDRAFDDGTNAEGKQTVKFLRNLGECGRWHDRILARVYIVVVGLFYLYLNPETTVEEAVLNIVKLFAIIMVVPQNPGIDLPFFRYFTPRFHED